MRADRLTRVFPALLAALATGCLSPADPDARPVAAVRVTFDAGASEDTIGVRGVTRVRATAVASGGYELAGRTFSYASSDTTVAVVDSAGVVRGVGVGTAVIAAAVPGGPRGTARVVVAPSTVAYEIAIGGEPRALAFSRDYTRLYAATGGGADSLVVIDALGFFRLSAVALGLRAGSVAAAGDVVYVTHPDADSVSIISTATHALTGRVWAGAGPDGVVADAARAFVAARYDRRVVILTGGRVGLGIPLGGAPHALALARDGRRLFATVEREGAWRLAVIAPAYPDTLESLALSSAPGAIATDADGARVWVLLPDESRVVGFAEHADGRYRAAGSFAVPAGANGLSVAPRDAARLVVSGEPLTIADGAAMSVLERIPGVGTGAVGVRPDGVFAFVAEPAARLLRVVGL